MIWRRPIIWEDAGYDARARDWTRGDFMPRDARNAIV
jgi:hypothetical protein